MPPCAPPATALEMMGVPPDRIQETTLMDFMPLVPEEDLRAFLAPLLDEKKREIVFETVLETSPDASYPVEIRMRYLKNENPPILVAIVHDTTERSRLGLPCEAPGQAAEARSAD